MIYKRIDKNIKSYRPLAYQKDYIIWATGLISGPHLRKIINKG